MTPAEFLKAVWPSSGYYCLATIFKTPEGKALYAHKVFDTIDEAAAFAARHKNEDIYFCVHSLKEKRVWNENKKNFKTGELGAWEYRKQTNMQEASSFFFDLDVGDAAGKYPTQRDALLALKQFVIDTGLPFPMVTSSGGGLHVYWIVDTSLRSNEWVTTAARLKALANHHGLLADPARTTDIASVLRVAGTFNMKDKSNPREVKVLKATKPAPLDEFLKRVSDAVVTAGVTPENARPKKSLDATDDYFGGANNTEMEFTGKEVTFPEVLKACPLAVDLTRRADSLSEPEWHHGLSIVGSCRNGRANAHKWSSKYPGYTFEETESRLDRLDSFKGKTCAKLQEICGVEKCAGCKYKGQVYSPFKAAILNTPKKMEPIIVGPVEAPTTIAVCPPPYPYKILKAGQVVRITTDASGDETSSVIYDYPLYPLRRLRNEVQQNDQLIWRVEHTHDGHKDFVMDGDALIDTRRFGIELVKAASIYVDPENLGMLRQYMTAYVRELQRMAKAETQNNYLGWNTDQTEFTLYDKIICADGTTKPSLISTNVHRAAKGMQRGPQGTLQRQVELLEFFNRPEYVAHQVMILQGLAAVSFYATGYHGMVINAMGEPGASKSTALYTAASFWAEPEAYTMNGNKDGSTQRARAAIVGVLSSLPVCIDEITLMDPAEAARTAFNITQPRSDKDGLNQKGELREATGVSADGGHKSSLLLSSSNSSLQGLLAQDSAGNTAGAVRVLEMYFSNPHVHEKWEAEEYLMELKKNYGHIGEAFVRLWLRNKETNEAQMKVVKQEVDRDGKITSGERFWGGNFAAVLHAGRLAKADGLIPFDMDYIKHWLIHVQLKKMRGVLTQEFTGPVGLLTDFLSQTAGDILVTDKMNNSVDVIRKPRGPLLAHYHVDKRVIWVLRAGFRDFCQKRKINYLTVLDSLAEPRVFLTEDRGVAMRIVPSTNTRKTLGVGTEFAGPQAWVFEIDMNHPEMSGALPVLTNEKPDLSPSRADLRVVKTD